MFTHPEDRGRTWTPKRPLTEPLHKKSPEDIYWNCARITTPPDARLAVVVQL